MRGLVLLAVLIMGMARPAWPAKPANIQQLEQLLDATHGQSDHKVSNQIAGLELTERISSARLTRWLTELPGRHSRDALIQLADAAAFLDLPAADMPAINPPALEAQRAMLSQAVQYAAQAIARLPNFYATRTTEHFADMPPGQQMDPLTAASGARDRHSGGISSMAPEESAYEPMHLVDKSSVTVSYSNGYELRGSKRVDFNAPSLSEPWLATVGEFGPILSVVLSDAVHGAITWGYWEQGQSGTEAVFRYLVTARQSNYMVELPHGDLIARLHPAYHGEIAIDPADGSILRITLVAIMAAPWEMVRNAIQVEYGLIPLGGSTYLCPVRSVALSRTPRSDPENNHAIAQNQLNDVAFTNYHLFRSESRIVPVEP